ncbi:PREDICTED: DIS3-like exonuclease 2 isoform X2 [Tarenaya hassleriana]|uniref:DIS3-like exonuclease 2 isoform X2 n=1 Tax=Tarenaya hassleriana TaxID=28532 RepID=UPI00053C6C41|nr:PREDICTED: DIS3-like exonuclease 2 isoform X2 [Tarenaya hassleriana]
MKSSVAEQSTAEKIQNGDKEKKKKRRSSRRSKHNSVGCGTEEVHNNEASDGRNGSKAKNGNPSPSCSSSNQQGLDIRTSDELGEMRACSVAFNSMPSMHLNGQAENGDPSSRMNGDLFQQIDDTSERKIFSSYWCVDAVNEALEKGEAFKALFRVNAHNRNEAYCKIDGVPTDILVNGIVAQNRAVEGDVVIMKLDPFSMWPKMKGFVRENTAKSEESNNTLSRNEYIAPVYGKGIEVCVSQCEITSLDSSSRQTEFFTAVEKLRATVLSFPSKRPTGQVVAVAEKSLRRDSIVGFLNVKQWIHYRQGDAKKNEELLSLCDNEYLQLMPADPKFPKLIVPFRDLPGSIRRRLESSDATIEAELVAAQIVDWAEGCPYPQAYVTHVFGRGGELEPQIKAILHQNSVCHSDFSPDSLGCLPHLPWEVPEEEVQRRKDLRNLCVFTIDPSTATDLDDALSVESLSGGVFRVGVHIADVSYFALPDTALDTEAQLRSTSVYMLQRKLPMLPPVLSENIGSLKPGADRLAFSIFWDLNVDGDVIDRWIGRTVIRSCCKLSYDHAQGIIDGLFRSDVPPNGWPVLHGPFNWSDVIRSVRSLSEISTVLRQKRFRNGALQLENSKPAFLFDESGTPYDFVVCGRQGSNFLVEEFMLLANTTAAEIISRAYPNSALLRRHPEPNMRKLKEFEAFCSKHGLELDISSSGRFHESLEKIREKLKDDSALVDIFINYATRPMQLATYFCSGELREDNVTERGHYALAVPLYTHFTSPLRRYPDIVVHRTVAAALEAEEFFSRHSKTSGRRCFTGIHFDNDAAESMEGKEALSIAALKHGVPCSEMLADVAGYCNERKLACRNVRDACDKLYMWFLLKKKRIILSEARVVGLGPRFMSIYISKLGIERRIYYDEVDLLTTEWLEGTSTLILSMLKTRRGGRGNNKLLKEVAHVLSPYDLYGSETDESKDEIVPAVFPLTVRLLATVPVALHAVGGDDGPIDIGVRLYMSTYHST